MSESVKKEKWLRRRFLQLVDSAKASGFVRGPWIAEILGIEDEELVVRLGVDLVGAGLVEVRDSRSHARQDLVLAFLQYKVTAKGTALLAGAIPVEPLVEDERIS